MRIKKQMDNNVVYINILNEKDKPNLAKLANLEPFKAIVIVEKKISDDQRDEWVNCLLNSKCFCMMAWGHDSSKWDDEVDMACVMQHIEISKDSQSTSNDVISCPDKEEKFILTSWHENETLKEVFELCLLDNQLENYDPMIVLLHFSNNDSINLLDTFLQLKANV